MANLFQYYNRQTTTQGPNKANAVSPPTFEDLSIDDNLPALDRLVRYSQSAIGLQRLVHVKMLADVASSVGFAATKEHIIPLLVPLSKDSEPAVRQHLCEQLIPLSKFCIDDGAEEGYRVLLEKLLPVCQLELVYEKVEVRQSACVTMVALGRHVRPEDIGKDVLTIVLRLAHEDENEEMRMTACELLNMLAEQLGQELCQQFVIPEIVSLAEDPNFRVRKATALNFHNICKVGGEHELFERLMPAFVRLSKDDMYRVRRACGESLAKISQFVNDDIKSGVLVEIFLRLAQDMSKLVKQSVLQQSGMFIATLPPKIINDVILGHFKSLTGSVLGDAAVDADLKFHCAHTFPAVLLTIGPERWTEIREIYFKMVQSQNLNVRVTLALSLHEIARILGPAVTEEELLSVFEEMIQPTVLHGNWERIASTAALLGACALPMSEQNSFKRFQQDVEAVRMGVLRHLAVFLSFLSQPSRISYLPLLNDILHTTNQFNWRLRQTLASQLPDLMTLPPPHNVYNTLFPLAMTLLQDPVAQVRQETFKGVAKMLVVLQGHSVSDIDEMYILDDMNKGPSGANGPPTQLSGNRVGTNPSRLQLGEEYVTAVARAINALTFGDTFQQRQLWVELCHRLLRDLPQDLFESYFVEGLIRLSSDPVLNVRVAVAMLFGGWEPEDVAPWETPQDSSSPPQLSDCDEVNDARPNNFKQRASPWTYLMKRTDIRECVERLSQDDRDVYYWVSKLKTIFPNVEFKSIPCRGRKGAPGGNTPVMISEKLGPEPMDFLISSGDISFARRSTDGLALETDDIRSVHVNEVVLDLKVDELDYESSSESFPLSSDFETAPIEDDSDNIPNEPNAFVIATLKSAVVEQQQDGIVSPGDERMSIQDEGNLVVSVENVVTKS